MDQENDPNSLPLNHPAHVQYLVTELYIRPEIYHTFELELQLLFLNIKASSLVNITYNNKLHKMLVIFNTYIRIMELAQVHHII